MESVVDPERVSDQASFPLAKSHFISSIPVQGLYEGDILLSRSFNKKSTFLRKVEIFDND